MKLGGSFYTPNPCYKNSTLDETQITVRGKWDPVEEARVTLGNVFNKLRKDGILPDNARILNLWYINRYHSPGCTNEVESDENSDQWWYDYICKTYSVNFVSCTLFDNLSRYYIINPRCMMLIRVSTGQGNTCLPGRRI